MENRVNKKIGSYKDLETWKEAHKLVLATYSITEPFPKAEIFGLTSQMRRAALSISSNIAEGFGRFGVKEKLQFFNIARGSLIELDNQLCVARDVRYINDKAAAQLIFRIETVHKLLNGLRRYAKTR